MKDSAEIKKTNLFFLIVIMLIALTQSASAYEPVFTVDNVDDNTTFYNGYDDISFGFAEGAGAGGKNVNENQVLQQLYSHSKPPIGTNSQLVFSCYYGSYTVPEDGWYEVSYTGSMLCERMAFGPEAIPITTNDWSVNVDLVWEDQENLERIESMSKEYNFWTRSAGVVIETAVLAADVLLSGATAGAPAALKSISTIAKATYVGSKQLLSIVETIDDLQFRNTETITKTTTKYLEAGQTYQWMWGVQTQLTTDTLLEAAVFASAYTQLSLDSVTVTPLFALTYDLSVQANSLVSISVSPEDNNGNAGAVAPFSRTYLSGTSVTVTAPQLDTTGKTFSYWEYKGNHYSHNSLAVTMSSDKTVRAVYLDSDSQIEVAGSTNPDTLETTIAPGNGKWFEIPVRNTGHSSVTVDCSTSGNAASWATLASSSFTIESQEINRHRVTIHVPDNTSSGTYTLNIQYNSITFPISIRVAASGDDHTEQLYSDSVWIDGASSQQSYSFDNSSYYSFDISGMYRTHAQTYCTVSDSDYLNAGAFRLYVPVTNLDADNIHDLIVYINNELAGQINAEDVPKDSAIRGFFLNNISWAKLKSDQNIVTFTLRQYNNNDATPRWRIYDNIQMTTNKTTSAWGASNSVSIPYNTWTDIEDGYMQGARVYADVDQVLREGAVYLYNNGEQVSSNTIGSSDTGNREYWSLSRSELEEGGNYFVFKGDTSSETEVRLSNIEFVITFNNDDPILSVTKSLSSNQAQIGEQVTVTVEIENTRENSSTGYDTDIYDSVPSGLTLVSGNPNRTNIGKIDFEDKETNVYIIRADQSGRYVLPSARVEYQNIDGDNLVEDSSPVEFVVVAGTLEVSATILPPVTIGSKLEYSANVVDSVSSQPVQDASVRGILQKETSGNWETVQTTTLGWSPDNDSYLGNSTDIAVSGTYRAYVVAQKDLYSDGQSGYESFTVTIPTYTLTTFVTGEHGTISDGGTYEDGTVITLTATPDAGYRVKSWSGTDNDSSTATTNTVTMTGNKTVAVEFESITPTVSITATDPSAAEPADNGYFTVSRTGSTSGSLLIGYATSGTAIPGTDYLALAGSVDIPDGQPSALITVVVIDDSQVEIPKTVTVGLAESSDYDLGQDQATLTIADDDDKIPPQISGLVPDADSFQIALDTVIQLHITDRGSGVEYDGGTVTILVDGDLIYDGSNETSEGEYDSTGNSQAVRGVCTRSGTPADYTFVFQPSTSFDYEQKVDVTVNATDKADNVMPEESYYFHTVMRTFGPSAKVNSDVGTLVQDNPATAADSSGNIWIVWDEMNAAGNTDIYVGKLTVGATSFGTSVRLTSNSADQLNPAVALGTDDKLYVVWQDNRQADGNNQGEWDIYISTSVDGTNWSAEIRVNDPNEDNQFNPAIVVDSDSPNSAHVAWQDDRAGNHDICIATSSNGFATKTVSQITSNTSDQTTPAIAVDSSNTVYVLWTDARNTANGTDIYGAAGSPWTNVPLINTASNQSNPVCAVSDGVLHLLWVDDADTSGSVFYASVTGGLQGTVVGDPDVVDERTYAQTNPAIAAKSPLDQWSAAKVFTCWQDARWINDGDNADIYFAETASTFGTNILVNDDGPGSTQTNPAIGINKDGNPYIVWVDDRNGNNDIYYAGPTAVGSLATNLADVGGTVTVQAPSVVNLAVVIPAGALPNRVDANNITIAQVSNLPAMPAGSGGFGTQYKFGPSGLQFNSPVTIRIPHTTCPAGYSTYRVYRYDPSSLNFWSEDGIHNPATHSPDGVTPHYLEVQVDHFSTFAAGGSVPAPAPAPTGGGGGGGGGGGCALSTSPHGPDSVAEFLLPYVLFVIVLLVISWVDARRGRAKSDG